MLEINYSHWFFVHNFVFFSQAWVNKIYYWPWVPNLAITEHAVAFRLNQCLLEYVIKPYVFVGKKNIRPFKLCLYKDSQSLKLGMSLNNGYLISNVSVDVNERTRFAIFILNVRYVQWETNFNPLTMGEGGAVRPPVVFCTLLKKSWLI